MRAGGEPEAQYEATGTGRGAALTGVAPGVQGAAPFGDAQRGGMGCRWVFEGV